MADSIKKISKNLVIFLLGIVLGLVLAEGALRIYELMFVNKSSRVTDLRGLTISDPKVGWRMKPNISLVARTDEFDVIYRTNSSGYRDYEFDKRKGDGAFRIFVFGDSFAFGAGVAENETFPKQLEKLLNYSKASKKYEVYNFGVGRYGNAQELLILKENMEYKPDLILVELIAENRFVFDSTEYGSALKRNIEFLSPKKNKKIILNDISSRPMSVREKLLSFAFNTRAFLLKHSALYKRVERLFGLQLRLYFGGLKASDTEKLEYAWQVLENIFKDFKIMSEKNGFPIVVIYYPYAYDAYRGNNEVYDKLSSILNPMGINVINLVPVLYKNRDKKLYYPLDGHPTPVGQKIVAEEIHRFLTESGYLSKN